jgi:hypothetical protein
MDESLKDHHRQAEPQPGVTPAPDRQVKMELVVMVDKPPVQSMPPPASPLWVPWALHH